MNHHPKISVMISSRKRNHHILLGLIVFISIINISQQFSFHLHTTTTTTTQKPNSFLFGLSSHKQAELQTRIHALAQLRRVTTTATTPAKTITLISSSFDTKLYAKGTNDEEGEKGKEETSNNSSNNNSSNKSSNKSSNNNNNNKKKKKKKIIILNPNLIGTNTISSDGILTEQKKQQQKKQQSRDAVISNLGKTTKKKKNNNNNSSSSSSNTNKKRLSNKAQKIADQRTANGTVNGMLQAGLAIPEDQKVQIQEIKRGNKQVTIVRGLVCPMPERKKLLKEIKKKIGGGGSLIDGIIELQGSHSDVVMKNLKLKGYVQTTIVR